MSPALKRQLSSASRSISPPPVRRCLTASTCTKPLSPTRFPHNNRNPQSLRNALIIYSWNVNGISPLLQKQISFSPNSTYPLRTFLKEHNWPHFLCLQEVKIKHDDAATQRRVELAANNTGKLPSKGEPTYTAHFSLPRDRYNATWAGGRVHGVATLIRDDALQSSVATAPAPAWDLEGRVLVHEFSDIPLVLVNGYWVNGTSNPYRDPATGAVQGTRHEHKLRFHAHMLELCRAVEERGKYVLLVGDMNVAPRRIDGHPNLRVSPVQHVVNRADFNAKFLDGGLGAVDVFRHVHGSSKKFTYHGRGRPWGESCDRVDLVIASRGLVGMDGVIVGTDICDTPKKRGHSDHVPLWVSIDTSSMLDREAHNTLK